MSGTEPSPEPIEIRYDLTIEAYLRAIADWALDEQFVPHAKKYRTGILMRWFWWILAAAIGVYWFLRANNDPDIAGEIRVLCIGLGVIVFAGVAAPKLSLMRVRKTMAKETVLQQRTQTAPHRFSPTVLRIGSDGIEYVDSVRTIRTEWAGVVGVRRTRSALFIETVDDFGPIIPVDAIDGPTLAKIEALVGANAGGAEAEGRVIVRVLRDRDLLCPGCKYQCRGVAAPRCPECGRAITKDDLLLSESAAHVLLREYLDA